MNRVVWDMSGGMDGRRSRVKLHCEHDWPIGEGVRRVDGAAFSPGSGSGLGDLSSLSYAGSQLEMRVELHQDAGEVGLEDVSLVFA